MVDTMKRWGIGLAGGLSLIMLPCIATTVAADQAGRLCWTPGQLANAKGDNAIRQNIRAAYRPRPSGDAVSTRRSVPYGAVRRVDIPGRPKVVALTFDMCEQPHEISGYQGDIVDYLRRENVRATFFATGKWLLTHPARGEQLMADRRFEMAGHGWSHRNFRILRGSALDGELEGSQAAYQRTRARLAKRACFMPGARRMAHVHVPARQTLMRFPFGACTAQALKAVQRRKLLAIQWDVSSADPWRGMTADKMVHHVVSRVRSGSIVLFHANGRGWHTGNALPRIVAALRARGYRFATVSEMLAMRGAQPQMVDSCYDHKPGDSERYDGLARRLEIRYAKFRERFSLKPDDPR